jgi:CHRD domain
MQYPRIPRLMHLFQPLKWSVTAALVMGLVACGSNDDDNNSNNANNNGANPPAPSSRQFSVALSGEQEVPPTTSGALGTGTLSFDAATRNIIGSITLDGITANAAHIHQADAGVSGPIIVPLTQTTPGTWSVPPATTLTVAQADALAAGGLYFNAHTTANPNGDVRGQIGRDVFGAQLSSAQEVPSNASSATGTGLVSLDPDTKKFSARLTVTGLAATAAHIHTAPIGVSGPIRFPLTETPAGSGVWVSAANETMNDAEIAVLKAGGLYFNAHSAALPNGEIRGQIGRNVRFASLSASQEVPPTSSTATGSGTLVVNPATRAASGAIAVNGLTATAAHIHLAPAGAAGAIIIPLTSAGAGVFNVPSGTVLTADQLQAYKQGNLYYNAHSTAFPNGEIRGQIR